jgi:cytochrome c oxidase subunit III
MAERRPLVSVAEAPLAHHFEDLKQQHNTGTLGMWVFLATEVMFFGGVFTAYAILRARFPADFAAASRQLYIWIGAANTAVLLTSSLTMALALYSVRAGRQGQLVVFLGLTLLLGAVFLGVKVTEYYIDYKEQLIPGPDFSVQSEGWQKAAEETGQPVDRAHAQLFFVFYFFLTLLHATHMVVGMVIMAIQLVRARRGQYTAIYNTPIELMGLYWHFVDIIWVFLFPLLYLVRD